MRRQHILTNIRIDSLEYHSKRRKHYDSGRKVSNAMRRTVVTNWRIVSHLLRLSHLHSKQALGAVNLNLARLESYRLTKFRLRTWTIFGMGELFLVRRLGISAPSVHQRYLPLASGPLILDY